MVYANLEASNHADNPWEATEQLARWEEWFAARNLFSAQASKLLAVNAAAIARTYPHMDPELAAPIMMEGIPYNAPPLTDIVMRDQFHKARELGVITGLKSATRWGAAALDLPVRGYQQLGQTIVNMIQGKTPVEAFRASGSGILSEALQQGALNPDTPINLGDGWLPTSEMPWEMEGFAPAFRDTIVELGGDDPAAWSQELYDEALSRTSNTFATRFGQPVTARSDQELASTPLRKTLPDGRTVVSHYTPVNLALHPFVGHISPFTGEVIEPDELTYETISRWGQLLFEIGGDPLNIPLLKVGEALQARRVLPIQAPMKVADNVAGTVGKAKRSWFRPDTNWYATSREGRALSQYLTETDSISQILDVLDPNLVDPGDLLGIARATTQQEVDAILTPYLGVKVKDIPRGHKGLRGALNRAYHDPDSGAVYRMVNPVASRLKRWGAVVPGGMLDGTDLAGSLITANNYLRILDVPPQKIDSVLELIASGDGVNFIMRDVAKQANELIADALAAEGWNADDIRYVLGDFQTSFADLRSYHADNMGNPIHGPYARVIPGPKRRVETPIQRPPTPGELAPEGTMRTSDLLGARRAADPTADPTLKADLTPPTMRKVKAGEYQATWGKQTFNVTRRGNAWEITVSGRPGRPPKPVTVRTLDEVNAHIASRTTTDPNMRALGESISREGITEPVVVQYHEPSRTYRVVDGNKRVLAADALGLEEVPVVIEPLKRRTWRVIDEPAAEAEGRLGRAALLPDKRHQFVKGDPIPDINPTLESEMTGDVVVLPDIRSLRRMTTTLHQWRKGLGFINTDVVGKAKPGEQAKFVRALDVGVSVWRDFQLLAVRWAFNVLPDEMLRFTAAGFDSPINHPIHYLGWRLGGVGDVGLTGDRLHDSITAADTGAAYYQHLREVYDYGHVVDPKASPWRTIAAGDPGHLPAWRDQVIRLWADRMSRRVAADGIDEAYKYFTATREGREIIANIVGRARQGTQMSRLRNRAVLRAHLEEVQAKLHAMTGGEWVAYNVNPRAPGQWVDSNSNIVDPPKDWDGSATWVITHPGDADLIELVASGRVKSGKTRLLEDGTSVPTYRRILHPDPQGITDNRQVEALTALLKGKRRHWRENERRLGLRVPQRVRGPHIYNERLRPQIYDRVVTGLFSLLGTQPSHYLMRSPFFAQRYWREVAEQSVYATEKVQEAIRLRAKQAKVTDQFDEWRAAAVNEATTRKVDLVDAQRVWDNIDGLDSWARSVGLADTKNLFYELAQTHNIVDMNRHIFVFAEAWYEILSRWSRLLSPTAPRGAYNLEKLRQVGSFATQSGFFAPNEFGQETYNYPWSIGSAIMGNALSDRRSRIIGQVSPEQLFSNPLFELASGNEGAIRSVVAPGFGPAAQLLLPPVQAMLPPSWQDDFQFWTTGEFPIAAGGWRGMLEQGFNTMPSSIKALFSLVAPDDVAMLERRVANQTAVALEALALSGDYPLTTAENQQQLERDALNLGVTLGIARFIDSLFSPENPRYIPQVTADMLAVGKTRYIDAAALGHTLRFLEDVTGGDRVAAVTILGNLYGIDPLRLQGIDLPRNQVIEERPVTETPFQWVQGNREFVEAYPVIAYAFSPDDPHDPFYMPAWIDQIRNGTAQPLTTEDQVKILASRRSALMYQARVNESETRLNQAKRDYPSWMWPRFEKAEADWLRQRRMDIEAMYPGTGTSVFDINAHARAGRDTPRFGDFYDDLERAVVRDSQGRVVGPASDAAAANPMVAEFIAYALSLWDEPQAVSRDFKNDPHTWLRSNADWALYWQNTIAGQLGAWVDERQAAGDDTVGVRWLLDRFFMPVMKGADWEAVAILDPGAQFAPSWVNAPSGPPPQPAAAVSPLQELEEATSP